MADDKRVIVSAATGSVYVADDDRPKQFPVSLITRDIAGIFVETLSQKQIAMLMRHLKLADKHKSMAHGTIPASSDEDKLSATNIDALRHVLRDIGANPSEAEIRALSAVLSDTSGIIVHGLASVLTPAGRLRDLTSNPVGRVWSSEAWHTTLKRERKRASAAILKATQKSRERREKKKIERLENTQTRFKEYAITSRRVHEKARRHLEKVQNEKLAQYQQKWNRVEERKAMRKKNLDREKKEQSIHIKFESMLNRFRLVDMLGPRLRAVCNGMDSSEEGVLRVDSFFNALSACLKMATSARKLDEMASSNTQTTTTSSMQQIDKAQMDQNLREDQLPNDASGDEVTTASTVSRPPTKLHRKDMRLISRVLDPNSSGFLSYGDFLWALRRRHGANGHLVKDQSIKKQHSSVGTEREEAMMRETLKQEGVDLNDESKILSVLDSKHCENSQGTQSRINTVAGQIIVAVKKVSGLQKKRNICARVDVSNVSWQTPVRWFSDSPVFNQIMNSKLSPNSVNQKEKLTISILECDSLGKPKRTIGSCQLCIEAPSIMHGVEFREYSCRLVPPFGLPQARENASKEEHARVAAAIVSLPVVHFTAGILPQTIPAWLVADKPGHHALGRVRWTIERNARISTERNSGKAHSDPVMAQYEEEKTPSICFIFRGILVMASILNEEKLNENGNLTVLGAFPVWGSSVHIIDPPDSQKSTDGFFTELDIISGEVSTADNSKHSAIMKTTLVTPSTLSLEVLDCPQERFLQMVQASAEYFQPQGGWCPGSNLPGSSWGISTFECTFFDTVSGVRWPGTFSVSREMCVFRGDEDCPLGAKNIEISLASIENALIDDQNISPCLNALRLVSDVGEGTFREWKFSSFPGASIARQCILQRAKAFDESVFSPSDLKIRRRKGLRFPAQRAKFTAQSTRKKKLSSNQRRAPPHRRPEVVAPIIQKVLGLTIVNNLKPVPPRNPSTKSYRSQVQRTSSPANGLSPRRALASFEYCLSPETFDSPLSGGESPYFNITKSSPTLPIPIGTTVGEWMDSLEVIALLGDGIQGIGQGKPFSQLVVHTPSSAKLSLQVVPGQAQNMFMLARQSIVALRVKHKYLMRCFGTAQVGESIKFLWDYLPNTLQDVVSDSRTPKMALCLLKQLIGGLGHMHSLGIIHRNVNPCSIHVSLPQKKLRLGAFGLSKYIGPGGRTRTQCGMPIHMSPERILGQPHGFGCDWWGVGTVLHAMVSGGSSLYRAGSERSHFLPTLYEQISGCRYEIAESISPVWIDVISRFLSMEPSRLGCVGRGGLGSSSAEVLLYLAAHAQNEKSSML